MGLHSNVKKLIDENALASIEIKEMEDFSGTTIAVNGTETVQKYIVSLNRLKLLDNQGEITK